MEPALAFRGFILGFTIAAAVGPISLLVIRRTLAEGRVVGLASDDPAYSSCSGSPERRPAPHDPASAPARRGGLAGAYLSILGLTLTNPITILSFRALFAALGVTGGDAAGAAQITLGVLGSGAWWVLLTTIVSALRTRITTAWIRRVNVASGVVIAAFAVVSVVL